MVPVPRNKFKLNEEFKISESNGNYSEALLKTVVKFVTEDSEDESMDNKIVKLEAVKKVLDPDSELKGHISPFDALIDMAQKTREAIENMKNREYVDEEYSDYDDDLPRHYYGEEGEVLFYDD